MNKALLFKKKSKKTPKKTIKKFMISLTKCQSREDKSL